MLIAIRSADAGFLEQSGVQSIAVSDDRGPSWLDLSLPAPDGRIPLVFTAAEFAGRLVLGGSTHLASPEPSGSVLDPFAETADAAMWVGDRGGFERLAESQFDDEPRDQEITELIEFDGRLLAIGTDSIDDEDKAVAWESEPGGMAWSRMDGLPVSGYSALAQPAFVRDGALVLRLPGQQVSLAPGSSSWERDELISDPEFAAANEVPLPDGSVAFTMTDEFACNGDCPKAFGGRVDGDGLDSVELSFADCEQDPQSDFHSVSAPALLGSEVVALASCNGKESIAHSPDGGVSWATVPVSEVADGSGDVSLIRGSGPRGGYFFDLAVFLPDDDELVGLLYVTETFDEQAPYGWPPLAQVLVVRVSAPD